MLPLLMIIIGICFLFQDFIYIIFGVPLLAFGCIMWFNYYQLGNVTYWEWAEKNKNWQILKEKRRTIINNIADRIEYFSKYESNMLKNLGDSSDSAVFLLDRFPNIQTMGAVSELYYEIKKVESEINSARLEVVSWNRQLQQMSTNVFFFLCLPPFVLSLLLENQKIDKPQSDLMPDEDDGK